MRLHQAADAGRSPAFRLETRSVGGRLVGANAVPAAAWFDEPEQVLRLLAVAREVLALAGLHSLSESAHPAIPAWVAEHPLRALVHHAAWPKVTATVLWLRSRVA